MSKSTPKGKKESLPVIESAAPSGEASAQAAMLEKNTKKPARKTVKKVVSEQEAAPAQVVAEKAVPVEQIAPQVEVEAATAEKSVEPEKKTDKQNKTKKTVAPKKAKLIRDSFTFPEGDYALLAVLKQRAMKAGRDIKKSELLRAGLIALNALNEDELLKALDGVERIKTGRPSN